VIASGNSIVLLAPEQKPLSAITLAEVINDSDVSGGVVNILTGNVKELIEHFSSHMDVNALYFNSSNAENQKQAEQLASLNVKRCKIENNIDWFNASEENPYRILDFTEVKTTWHPIGI
jgi:acyl-CoA reductase-like NAD-dependent aldehyde dehydrogenase